MVPSVFVFPDFPLGLLSLRHKSFLFASVELTWVHNGWPEESPPLLDNSGPELTPSNMRSKTLLKKLHSNEFELPKMFGGCFLRMFVKTSSHTLLWLTLGH